MVKPSTRVVVVGGTVQWPDFCCYIIKMYRKKLIFDIDYEVKNTAHFSSIGIFFKIKYRISFPPFYVTVGEVYFDLAQYK
jgi:hypothetical protein